MKWILYDCRFVCFYVYVYIKICLFFKGPYEDRLWGKHFHLHLWALPHHRAALGVPLGLDCLYAPLWLWLLLVPQSFTRLVILNLKLPNVHFLFLLVSESFTWPIVSLLRWFKGGFALFKKFNIIEYLVINGIALNPNTCDYNTA